MNVIGSDGRTDLKKTRSPRVRCFATPDSIIATATWAGLSVLGGSRLAIVALGVSGRSDTTREDKKHLEVEDFGKLSPGLGAERADG